MYELLVCHRRSRRTGRAALGGHWRNHRRRLVADLKDGLGYESYVQLHRASRLNVFYLGILLSRSWPMAALFSAMEGLPLPPLPLDRRRIGAERWDVVERFRYPAREALLEALRSGAGLAAAARLSADAAGWVRHSAAMIAEVVPAADDPALGHPRTVTLFCLRGRRAMSRAEMLDRWSDPHKPLVLSQQAALGYRAYDQLHVREAAEPAPALAALGGGGAPFDGVAMLAFRSQRDLAERLFSPAAQRANLRLARDEVNFVDAARSALIFGTEA